MTPDTLPAVPTAAGPRSVLRGVAHLSVGTVVAQGLAVTGQFALAIWLAPTDFGLWATASSSIVILTGLVNFGEVNGYLSSTSGNLHESRRAVWRMNSPLVVAGLVIAAVYFCTGRPEVALLVAIATVNLPLLGDSNLLYAAFVKRGGNADLVRAQVVSALARTAVGIAVAWLTGEAMAFGIAILCYSAILIRLLSPRARSWSDEAAATIAPTPNAAPWHRRVKQSGHALLQLLPTQIDYFVVSLIATPHLLGVYFLSFQVTVGLAMLVGLPLSRSVLSALAATHDDERAALGGKLISVVSAGAGILTCLAFAATLLVRPLLPVTWQDAAPTICLLLASLPARFVASVADSVLIADGRWWRGIVMNGIDTLGIAIVAVVAVTGSITTLAASMVLWTTCFTVIRVWTALRATPALDRITALTVCALTAVFLSLGFVLAGPYSWLAPGLAAVVCVASLKWRWGGVIARLPARH